MLIRVIGGKSLCFLEPKESFMRGLSFTLLFLALAAAVIGVSGAGPLIYLPVVTKNTGAPVIGGCAVFPADNAWNRDVSQDPVDPNSNNYINYLLQSRTYLHPDFGSDEGTGELYGIPYIVVPAGEPEVPISFTAYGDQSDDGPYPIPLNAPIEGGSDRHVLAVRSGECRLYELYRAFPQAGFWEADSGAIFDLNSNALRPAGWTSADAAGLPILPGLVRYDEVAAGAIRHALRFTVQSSQQAYVKPARHWASSNRNPNAPPMGLRLRLKASYDLSAFSGQARVILEAMKRYGLIVADNGSTWYVTGAADARWDNDDLNQIKTVPGSAFDVVQVQPGTLCTPDSPQTPDCNPDP